MNLFQGHANCKSLDATCGQDGVPASLSLVMSILESLIQIDHPNHALNKLNLAFVVINFITFMLWGSGWIRL